MENSAENNNSMLHRLFYSLGPYTYNGRYIFLPKQSYLYFTIHPEPTYFRQDQKLQIAP